MEKEQVEIEVTDLAFDGKAVGHLDGKVVFLKGGLPGETVLAEITRSKARYSEGIVRTILKKSPRRVAARCSHFEYCGGCTWQDLTYDDQLQFKKKQVNDCIERIGNLTEVRVHDVIGSSELFHYRNKMEFSFNVDEDSGFTLGLHKRGAFDAIFDVHECHLPQPVSAEIVAWFREYARAKAIPVYDVKHHTGYFRFVMIRHAKRTGDLMVNIVTHYGDIPEESNFIDEITSAFPAITTIVHNQNGQKSNIAVGEKERVLFGPGFIEEQLDGKTFRIRANSFFQTNSIQAETLYRAGFEMLAPGRDDRVLDLYCGTGAIGILLAGQVGEVLGVELVPDAVIAARDNAKLNQIDNISFFEGNVVEYLKQVDEGTKPFDVVIVDPPRAGLHPKALKQLLRLRPPKLLYISCNPATFARDAAALVQSGYRLPEVKPVDMFPHTMHIELASVFHRE